MMTVVFWTFLALVMKGLNARQVADGGGCLCGVESPAYSSATEVQRGGADYMRRTNYSGSDGSLDNDDEEGRLSSSSSSSSSSGPWL
jgi:hypothetical protein